MKKPTKKKKENASEFRQTSLNNIDIDKVNKYCKSQNSQYSNSYSEVIIKCKFLSGQHNRGSYQPMGNFSISVLTKTRNHSLNLNNISTIGIEFSTDTKEFPIGTICVQNPNSTINSNLLLQVIFHNQNQSTSTKLTTLNSQTQTFAGNYKISDLLEKRAFQSNIIGTSIIKIIKSSTLKTN